MPQLTIMVHCLYPKIWNKACVTNEEINDLVRNAITVDLRRQEDTKDAIVMVSSDNCSHHAVVSQIDVLPADARLTMAQRQLIYQSFRQAIPTVNRMIASQGARGDRLPR